MAIDDVRTLGSELGRSYPVQVRRRLKLRVGQLDSASDLRFNWVRADLAALEPSEAREFVVDAWRMIVPRKLSRAYGLTNPYGPG